MDRSNSYILILLLMLAVNFSIMAQDKNEINILFIGNSFTARHDLSSLVKEVIEEGKPELTVNVMPIIYGGQSLFQHTEYYFSETFIEMNTIQNSTIHQRIAKMEKLMDLNEPPDEYIHFWQEIRNRINVPDFPKELIEIAIWRHENLLKNNPQTKWDYIVLQSWDDEVDDMNDGYAKYARYLTNIAKEQGAEVILYITAPDVQNQAPVLEALKQEEVDREINYALELARELKPYAVVHVPLAINMIQDGGTELTFRYETDFHPNQRTAFLTANMFYAALFHESTEGFEFNSVTETKTHTTENEPNVKLDPDGGPATMVFEEDEKIYLQQMAYNAVMKFVQWWKGEEPIPISEFSIVNPPSDTIGLGKNYQLHISIKPLYATNKSVIWEVTSGNAISVDENGLVKTLAEGNASIKATTANGELSDSCEINVKKKVIAVYGISMSNCPTTILKTGDTHQLVAHIAPADADNDSVTWSSSNPEVAMVDETGLVSALSQGSVKIAATTNDGNFVKSCNIGIMSTATKNNELSQNDIKIYPNPASDKLYFKFSNTDRKRVIKVFNARGQQVYSGFASAKETVVKIDRQKLNGFIIIHIVSGADFSAFKIIVSEQQG